MSKALFIIAQNNFRDEELQKPLAMLKDAGHKCTIASIEKGGCKGMLGLEIDTDIAVRDASADDYDVFIVVGGSGSPGLAGYPEVLSLLRDAKRKNKRLASICLATMVLARAGVIAGKKATVYKTDASLKALKDGKVNFIDKAVVVDENLVTANGPAAAEEFGRKILEMLR